MAAPFFAENWETLSKEELASARARFAGFIEAVPDKDRALKEVIYM